MLMKKKEQRYTPLLDLSYLLSFIPSLISPLKEIIIPTETCECIIGVLNSFPRELSHLPDYTKLRKAQRCKEPRCVLHCKNLSYALQHCDFVIYNTESDPKIIRPDDKVKLNAILS